MAFVEIEHLKPFIIPISYTRISTTDIRDDEDDVLIIFNEAIIRIYIGWTDRLSSIYNLMLRWLPERRFAVTKVHGRTPAKDVQQFATCLSGCESGRRMRPISF